MKNNVEIIQINISGEDKPGMTSSLTEILARYDAFYGTMQMRGEDGAWYEVIRDDEGEEET